MVINQGGNGVHAVLDATWYGGGGGRWCKVVMQTNGPQSGRTGYPGGDGLRCLLLDGPLNTGIGQTSSMDYAGGGWRFMVVMVRKVT